MHFAPQPPYLQFTHGWYGSIEDKQPSIVLQQDRPPSYEQGLFMPEVVSTIERKVKELSPELRKLSLDIWSTFFLCDCAAPLTR